MYWVQDPLIGTKAQPNVMGRLQTAIMFSACLEPLYGNTYLLWLKQYPTSAW
jgi:hypothetical protein